jgi:hypothetical protein
MAGPNDAINQALRDARGEQLDLSDHQAVNRALRAAAGRDPGPSPAAQQSPTARPFTADQYAVRHTEPSPGTSVAHWRRWAWQHAAGLLDQHGRLPGEPRYDPASNGLTDPDNYDATGAVRARLQRWEAERD